MIFADLKNDFVFRRIFATHPDILCGLLNDLLDRRDEKAIVSIEYLPSEQLPLVKGAKLSILDVRCKDRAGALFIVEMQLIHVAGFINRVIYNSCKTYAAQLKAGEPYTKLADVVAISICDFDLWPDTEQDQKKIPRIPMLSRWYITENQSGTNQLLQVQYAFLELPKLPARKPDTGAPLWAWLFVHAPELTEMPADLPPGPFRDALELANEATFTLAEHEAYRKVMDEIQQAREYGAEQRAEGEAVGFAKGKAEGKAAGIAEGEAVGLAKGEAAGLAKGKAAAVLAVLSARGISVSTQARARIEDCVDIALLDRWISHAAIASSTEEVFAATS